MLEIDPETTPFEQALRLLQKVYGHPEPPPRPRAALYAGKFVLEPPPYSDTPPESLAGPAHTLDDRARLAAGIPITASTGVLEVDADERVDGPV